MKCARVSAVLSIAVLAACSTAGSGTPDGSASPDWVASLQANAIRKAEDQGRTELGCPAAKATVLSAKEAPPEYSGPRFVTPQRGVFQIGIDGCAKRASYLVVCERDLAKECALATPGPGGDR